VASYVSVKYFAVLRELASRDEEMIGLESGDTGSAIYLRLAERYGFPLSLHDVRLAIGDELVPMDQELMAGDSLVFIPPVAGG
jgi:molybdopterin converting factor small subunit